MEQINEGASGPFVMPTSTALSVSPDCIPNAHVTMDCRCGAHDMTDMAWFAKKFGPATTLGGLLSRYRCRWCGGRTVKFTIAVLTAVPAPAKKSPAANVIPFPTRASSPLRGGLVGSDSNCGGAQS
jgi:hypothetical protein